jgi:hypothetical protein
MVNASHDDQYKNYNVLSKRTHVNNVKYGDYLLAERKKLHGSIISGREITSEDLGGHASNMKPMTASHATQHISGTETENLKDGLQYRTITDEDNIASETEHTYNAASYVKQKPTKSNVEVINSERDVTVDQDELYVPVQDKEGDAFSGNYKREAELQLSSHGTPRVLHRPFSSPSRFASSPYRYSPVRTPHAPEDSDFQGSASSYYSSLSNIPHKSPSSPYVSKPTDSFVLASASYSPVASSSHRKPTILYDSPPRKPPSILYDSPPQNKPSILYGSPPRKPPSVSYESPPYKPSVDLHGSSSTLNYSPQYGSAPRKPSRPPYTVQPSDSYVSPTTFYSSLPHGSRPPTISEINLSHGPSRPSHISPPKKSSSPSYHLHSGNLYESPTSSYSSLPHGSRPSTSTKSPAHKSHRPSYISAQASQYSEIYESPASSYSSSYDSKPITSDSKTHGSQKPLYNAPSLKSPSPSYDSQSSELYESPTSLYSFSSHDSRPSGISDISLSHGSHRPSYDLPPKKSHRPSHNSEFTDSYESPSSSYGLSHGSSSTNSSWSHSPTYDSPSSHSTITSYGSPSNLIYETPSSTFRESSSSSEGGSEDSTHTFVKTDHHGHVKWGVRHSVSNQKAGSHQ